VEKRKWFWKNFRKLWGKLIEANVINLKDNGINFSFIKKYKNPKADLLGADIFYSGTNNQGFIEGDWRIKNQEGRNITGLFYLANDLNSFDRVKEILGGLHFQKLNKIVENKQKQFPYTSII